MRVSAFDITDRAIEALPEIIDLVSSLKSVSSTKLIGLAASNSSGIPWLENLELDLLLPDFFSLFSGLLLCFGGLYPFC